MLFRSEEPWPYPRSLKTKRNGTNEKMFAPSLSPPSPGPSPASFSLSSPSASSFVTPYHPVERKTFSAPNSTESEISWKENWVTSQSNWKERKCHRLLHLPLDRPVLTTKPSPTSMKNSLIASMISRNHPPRKEIDHHKFETPFIKFNVPSNFGRDGYCTNAQIS